MIPRFMRGGVFISGGGVLRTPWGLYLKRGKALRTPRGFA